MSSKSQLEDLFAEAVRRGIALDGRSIDAVGRAAGFSRGYLSQLLRGRQDLKIKHVERILQALGIDPPALLRQVAEDFEEEGSTGLANLPASKLPLARGRFTWLGRRTSLSQSRGLLGHEADAESSELREVIRTILREELPQELAGYVSTHPISSEKASTSGKSENARLGYSRELDDLWPLPEVDQGEFDVGLAVVGAGAVEELAKDPLESVRRRRRLTRGQLEDKVKEARRWFRFLQRKVPEGEWCTKVQGAYKWYGGPVFGTFILEEARACFPEDAGRALLLADVALASCRKERSREPDPQVLIPALAVRANALRALGRLAEAEASLDEATRLLHSSELEDLLIPAELHSYLGSLRRDQGRLEEAAIYVRRAAVFFSLLRSREKAARTFIKLGLVEYQRGRPDAAVEAATKAIELLGPEDESWLAGYGRYNLALFLHGQGDTDRADEELAEQRELLAASGETVVAHVTWLRGRIAWSRGELAKADRLFREALRWARGRRLHFDAGLLCLERALVHLAQGRTDRVRKLVSDALGRFAREEEVERETRAALELLEAAARRDALTRKALERAVADLEGARQRRPGAGGVT